MVPIYIHDALTRCATLALDAMLTNEAHRARDTQEAREAWVGGRRRTAKSASDAFDFLSHKAAVPPLIAEGTHLGH